MGLPKGQTDNSMSTVPISYILGISAYYHDSAAALLRDGDIIAAAQEERFSRRKHDARFPRGAIRYCLEEGSVTLADVDRVVFYDKPLVKFERLLETYLSYAPRNGSNWNFSSSKLNSEKSMMVIFNDSGSRSCVKNLRYSGSARPAFHALTRGRSTRTGSVSTS